MMPHFSGGSEMGICRYFRECLERIQFNIMTSIFKKMVTSSSSKTPTHSHTPSTFPSKQPSSQSTSQDEHSKQTYKYNDACVLEEQVKILNSYIQELAKENEGLQQRCNDMKMTLQQNKQLLDDYINNIGENDQLVQKLKAEVDSLRKTNASKEEQIKQMNTQIQSLKHSPKQSIATTNFTTHIQETVVAQQTSHNKQQSNQHHGFTLVNCPSCKHQFKHAGNSGVSQSQKLLTDSLLRKQKELQAQLETFKQELGQLQEGSNFPTSRLHSKRSISLLNQASTIQPTSFSSKTPRAVSGRQPVDLI